MNSVVLLDIFIIIFQVMKIDGCTKKCDNKCRDHENWSTTHKCERVRDNHMSLCISAVKGRHRSLGSWSKWSGWTKCSVTCGYGTSSRHKDWIQPDKKNNFSFYDIIECWSTVDCPVHGRWGIWEEWTECPVMCDGGVQRRERRCNEPEPKFGGNHCYGAKWEGKECGMQPCPEIPANFSFALCDHTSFICESRQHCVEGHKRCDGTLHCHDGTDERDCYTHVQRWNGFKSPNGGSVISVNVWTLLTSLLLLGVKFHYMTGK